jgi:Ankyrin repeats (3 copies)
MAQRKAAHTGNKLAALIPHEKVVHEMSQRVGGPQALQRHLAAGHAVDELNPLGLSCLHLACRAGGGLSAAKLLLLAGADPNIMSTPKGYTPVMLAESVDIASYLLDNGADIEKVSSDGSTVLLVACCHGGLPVVRLLLERGAQRQILQRDASGESALGVARDLRDESVAMLLVEHVFAQQGFDVNHPSSWPSADRPLLYSAASAGMLKVAEAALAQGAAIDATAANGFTAVMNAVVNKHSALAGLAVQKTG